MNITATHINYFIVCKRKLWFFSNGISMEQTSDTVAEGKLIHETSYSQRAEKYTEIELSATVNEFELFGKIDFYDAKDKIIHEIKRSDKVEEAHEWQVKYYLWLLALNNIQGAKGLLEYPQLRQTKEVLLLDNDKEYLEKMVTEIPQIMQSKICPPKIKAKLCKNCSYYEFCYIEENES